MFFVRFPLLWILRLLVGLLKAILSYFVLDKFTNSAIHKDVENEQHSQSLFDAIEYFDFQSTPYNRRVNFYNSMIYRSTRIAFDKCQPLNKGSIFLPVTLLPKCLEMLGFFKHFDGNSETFESNFQKLTLFLLEDLLDEQRKGLIHIHDLSHFLSKISTDTNFKLPIYQNKSYQKAPVLYSVLDNTLYNLALNHLQRKGDLRSKEIDSSTMKNKNYQSISSPLSRKLAHRFRTRVKSVLLTCGNHNFSFPDYLMALARISEAKLNEKKRLKIIEEMKECTFQPIKLSHKKLKHSQNYNNLIDKKLKSTPNIRVRNKIIDRNHYLYYRGMHQAKIFMDYSKDFQKYKDKIELSKCSFGPKLATRTLVKPSNLPTPKMFEEAISRLKAARKRKEIAKAIEGEMQELKRKRTYISNPFSFYEGKYKVIMPPPILSITFEIGTHKKGLLVLHQDDNPNIVLNNFAKIFSLKKEERKQLEILLWKQIEQYNISKNEEMDI